jgi:mycobactin polyketide synthetase MbtD
VPLSGHDEEVLRADAAAILAYLDRQPTVTVGRVAAHLMRTRRTRRSRIVIRAGDRAELCEALRAVAAGEHHPLVSASAVSTPSRLAFVFPGQGTQRPGMGADAYRELAGYRLTADTCSAAFVVAGAPSPLRYLITGPQASPSVEAEPHSEIEIEGAQFVHAVGLAGIWRSYGIAPDLTVGHSLGEVAAAYIAGAISLADAVVVIAARAGVVDLLPGRYAVAALGVPQDEAEAVIASVPGWLELSVVNAPTSVAVSGDRQAVLAAVVAVQDRGRFAKEITVGFPVHTSVLEPLREKLRAQLPAREFADTAIQFVGSTIGDIVVPGTRFADYWYANLRDMVRFDRAVQATARHGARSFIEMSAHPALVSAVAEVLSDGPDDEPVVIIGSGHRDTPLLDTLSANIAVAAIGDPTYPWHALMDMNAPPLRGFPNAAMRRMHLWAQPEPLAVQHAPSAADTVITAAERWRETLMPDLSRSVAFAVLALDGGPLGRAVQATVSRRSRDAQAAGVSRTPDDAETLIVVAPQIDDTDAGTAAAALAALVADGLLDYPGRIGPACRTVCLLTIRGEQAAANDPAARAGHAALAAVHRSIGFEYPDVEFTHLDLPAADTDPDVILAAVHATTGSAALRIDGRRTVLLHRGFEETGPTPVWPAGPLDNVVITGGSGAVAAHYTRHLAELGARRIVLLSRRGTDPALLAALRAQHATEVVSVGCDITDGAAVATAAAEHARAGATLLIHAAGTATFAAAAALDTAAFADVCTAKIAGLIEMTRRWPLRADARILLCSSVSGLWGGRGHAAYAAANRLLDVVAAELRSTGHNCVAIRWGLWQSPIQGPGASGIVDAAEADNIIRSGLQPMDPLAAITAAMCDHRGDPLVYIADRRRLELFLSAGREQPPMVQSHSAGDGHSLAAGTNGKPSTAQMVRTELAAVLSITDAEALDLDASLFDLGVDSLLAVDLRKRLKRQLGRTAPLATLLGGVTGTELVGELDREKVKITGD